MLTISVRQGEHVIQTLSLLIIETDQTIRTQLQKWLTTRYTLLVAENGMDALATLRKQSVDLILLDVTISHDLEMLLKIRSRSDAPVILITSDSSMSVQGLQLGANDYLTRPLDANDVRARIETQLALKYAQDKQTPTDAQLKLSQEIQKNFTRMISHDLKGPLTNISMVQFMLRDMLRDNVEVNGILDNLDMTLTGMTEMIRVFLEAMDSQQLEPILEPLDIQDVIVQAMEQYRLTALRKEIQLTMRVSDHRAIADARLLRQVLSNLISNAVKFSQPGTQTAVWAENDGNYVRINVADGGPGIPAGERNRLFGMFSKLSVHPTGGEISTGLGLWIVKQLTELQGGHVGVDQPADGGSVFWIELPSA